MSLLADFETYLKSNNVLDVLYQDFMPDTPVTVASIYEYSGNTPEPQVAGATRSLQVVTRDTSPDVSRQHCFDIYKALQTEDGIINLTPDRWCGIYLKQPPFKLKMDQQGRVLYVFNLIVTTYIE